jgi:hypothetical protein
MMIQLGALRKAMDKDIEMGMYRAGPITLGQCAAVLASQSLSTAQWYYNQWI